MRHWGALIVVACLVAAGCGSDSTAPSTGNTNPNTVTFKATLLPANETPTAVTGGEAAGSGTATITFNLTRATGGAIQSGTVDFQYTMTGFPAGTTLILSHIHTGASGVAGGVLISTGQSAATALGLPAGSGSWAAAGVTGVDAATLQAIIDNPAGFYFNVHSQNFPGGVARGQLVKQ